MSRQSHRYAILAIAGLLLTAGCTTVFAQSQGDNTESVAEAARRAREQKKTAAKPVRTLTNDNLEPLPPVANAANAPATPAVAEENPAQANGEADAKPVTSASDDKSEQKKAESEEKLKRLKKELAESEGELDVLQRKAVLDNDSYYSKVDFASDKDGKAALDAEAQQIVDKKQAVEALKAKIAELEAIVGTPATAPADKENPPS
jgi:hypothetical protein